MAINVNAPFSDQIVASSVINPQVLAAAATATTAWVSLATMAGAMATIQTGTLGVAATVDAKLQQAKDASGAGAKDITGKAITQIVKDSGDDKQAIIEVRAEELDTNNDFTHVQLSITAGTADSPVSGILQGLGHRYTGTNPASVVERVIN